MRANDSLFLRPQAAEKSSVIFKHHFFRMPRCEKLREKTHLGVILFAGGKRYNKKASIETH